MAKSSYTKEELSAMGVYQIRQIAWEMGVHLSTTFNKIQLIDMILERQKNETPDLIEKGKRGRPVKNFVTNSSWVGDDFFQKKQDKKFSSWENGSWLTESFGDTFTNFAVAQTELEEEELVPFEGIFFKEANGWGTVHIGKFADIFKNEIISVSPSTVLTFGCKSGEKVFGEYFVKDGKKYVYLMQAEHLSEKCVCFNDLLPEKTKEVIALWNNPNLIFTKYLAPISKGQRAVVVGPKHSGKTFLLSNMAEEFANEGIHTIFVSLDKRPENCFNFKNPNIENVFVAFDIKPFHQVYVLKLAFERAKRLCEAGKDVAVLIDDINSANRLLSYCFSEQSQTPEIDAIVELKQNLAYANNTTAGGSITVISAFDPSKEQDGKLSEVVENVCNSHIYLDQNLKLLANTSVLPTSYSDDVAENMPQEFLQEGNRIKAETLGKDLREIALIYQEKMK